MARHQPLSCRDRPHSVWVTVPAFAPGLRQLSRARCLLGESLPTASPASQGEDRYRAGLRVMPGHWGPRQEARGPAPLHLPVPVARVAGDAVVQVPVGQRLLFIEDKLLKLHLHFCAGHGTWRGRKHGQVTGGGGPAARTRSSVLGREQRPGARPANRNRPEIGTLLVPGRLLRGRGRTGQGLRRALPPTNISQNRAPSTTEK